METVHSVVPLLALMASLIGAFLILFTGERNPNLREVWTMIASITKFGLVASMLPHVLQGKVIEYTIVEIYKGLALQFRVDTFGMIFALLASFLWIVVSLYSIGYMRGLNEHAQTRYYFCFAFALFGAVGVAMSGNLLTLYMFYEILTVATFPLVAHKETEEAIKAGRKYLAYLLTGAAFVLFSMGLTYYLTGTLDFKAGGFLAGHGSRELLALLFVTYIIGFGSKAAVMPIHEWLPSAMIAPTPVSALLHAVAVVKAGVFCCLRVILYVFGPKLLSDLGLWIVLAFFVSFTVIVANIIALTQDHLKRRLAFSTINNLSIIILGAALLSSDGIRGAMLHIPFHGFMKITLFMCAGSIYVKTHLENISEMEGIGRQMPITMAAFTIGAAGLTGIPPICGFISKWYLCLGALEAKEIIFLLVFLASALLDAAYFFPIIYSAFFKKPKFVKDHFDEASFFVVFPIVITAIGSIFFGIFPDKFMHFFKLALLSAKNILGV
ncbi:MAG: monovalent cation/H+ antiporter subunit D family protein [Candidatus Desulfofervidus auxilii]|nr:monovalent cation/H+ antiporter subunit D family protein [Candidatus Desulfofervidus auxilii]